MLVTLLLHAHHDGDGGDDDGGDVAGDVADDDGDFIKTSIVSVSSLVVGCDFDIKNKLHWLVVWLLVVAASQVCRVWCTASFPAGWSLCCWEGPTSPEELYTSV